MDWMVKKVRDALVHAPRRTAAAVAMPGTARMSDLYAISFHALNEQAELIAEDGAAPSTPRRGRFA